MNKMKFFGQMVLWAFLGAACTKPAPELNIYTSLDAQEAPIYIEKFEEKTKIKVNWVRLSAGEVLARIEGEKKNPQSSLWFGGPSPEFIVAKEKGLLEPYKPNLDFDISSANHDADWAWTGFYFGAIGFACNDKFFAEKKLECPKTWDDLLNPKLKGQISMAFPYTSGTAYTVIASLLQQDEKKAWEYISKLDKQVHHYNKSGSAAVTQTGLGEVAVGISFSHDILKKGKASGYPVTLSVPTDGTATEIGAMGLIKGGKHHESAKKFVDFMLSLEGQNLLKEFYRVALNPKAETAEGSIVASKIKLMPFDTQRAAREQKDILDQWRKVTSR